VGHGSVIEDDCFLASHAVVGGACRVGRASFLGLNSCVASFTSVAEDCFIGAGAAVTSDTAPRQVYFGNPARPTGGDSLAASAPSGSAHDAPEEGPYSDVRDSTSNPPGSVATDVLRIFREICFLPLNAPVDTTRPFTGLPDWDSIRQIEFIVRLEECFHVRLDEADLLGATTVGAVISTLEAKRGRS
jgi:acyl carrier protein